MYQQENSSSFLWVSSSWRRTDNAQPGNSPSDFHYRDVLHFNRRTATSSRCWWDVNLMNSLHQGFRCKALKGLFPPALNGQLLPISMFMWHPGILKFQCWKTGGTDCLEHDILNKLRSYYLLTGTAPNAFW